jgi:DNA mismatch repair protein MutL
MSHIKVLSAEVISRIAAGEVVDRPASVVKELVENSLDAGAGRVEVHLKDGGKTLIHVSDNGQGIPRKDLEILFNRHATSKISTSQDLESILSFGFRGEALYSVAAVAEVLLKSRAQGETEAWEVAVRGGAHAPAVPAARAEAGTDIKVGEIFFNTPARKKFLKVDHSEFEQALNVVMPYALYYPGVQFLLTHNGRTVLDLRTEASFSARASRALGFNISHLIEADDRMPDRGLKVRFVLGDINIQRPRRDLQYFFVNGRPVASRNMAFHVNETYKLILPPSAYPFFMVMLELPPKEVDVNIHPAKREVRLHEEAKICSFLRQALERVLMTCGSAREVNTAIPKSDVFEFSPGALNKEEGLPPERMVFGPGQKSRPFAFDRPAEAQRAPLLFTPPHSEGAVAGVPQVRERFLRARFLGTFARKYHLFEEELSLFAVDQHAAQERIVFERFIRQIHSGQLEVQQLLLPVLIAATPQEMLAWENAQDRLSALGFETTLSGPSTIALNSHPAVLVNAEAAVRVLLAEEDLPRVDHDTVARRACRASVMAGDAMTPPEAVHQIRELFSCQDPFTCPHGRPVFIELKSTFLDRQFLRS